MEVASVGEDEGRDEGKKKERAVKMAAVSPLHCGKCKGRKHESRLIIDMVII